MAEFLAAVKAFNEIVAGIKALTIYIKENREEAWFKESFETFSVLRTAKTKEQKIEVAKRLKDLITKLGS